MEGTHNRILYTGQQYDGISGQYYLRARYYNPVVGRFLQEDVYRGDGLNLYAYCRNNPVVYYDPSGYGGEKCETFSYKAQDGTIVTAKYTANVEHHLIYGDGIGAHNKQYFEQTLKNTGYPMEDLLIGKAKNHSTIDGIYEQKYTVPAIDCKTKQLMGYKNIRDSKTLYDPNKIPDKKMAEYAKDAMKNGTLNSNNRIVDGSVSINGNQLSFRGYITDGEFSSVFPIMD